MKSSLLNGVKTYAPQSTYELMDYAMKHHKIMVAVNAEKILHATDESRDIINRNLGYPDGMGAIWALRKKGVKNAIKIPGCELWLDIIKQNYKSKTFYLIGGKQEVINQTVLNLKTEYPGIKILNYRNGYIKTEDEELSLIEDVKTHKPDIIFVAMGSPKQEYLMEKLHQKYKATYQGLGGSFDVYTGAVKRAPKWLLENNLEWAYRLFKEPSRIKRHIHLIRFLILLKFKGI